MNNIQSKLGIFFTSSAAWTMIATVAYNAINANISLVPAGWSDVINIVLLVLAGYLHSSHVQAAAQMGSTKV